MSDTTTSGQTVYPALRYADAPAAIAWLVRTFGFEETADYRADDGSVMHAELRLLVPRRRELGRSSCSRRAAMPVTNGHPAYGPPSAPADSMSTTTPNRRTDMDVFVVSEPMYDICESWAEEPSPAAWEAEYGDVRQWLIRLN